MPAEAIEAPSAGAAVTATGADAGASPTPASATLTDDQILGIGSEGSTGAEEGQIAKPGAEPGAGEKPELKEAPDKPDGQEGQAATAKGALTEDVKAFFKAHPEVRDAYYRAEQFGKLFPDFKTAQKIAEAASGYNTPEEMLKDLAGVREMQVIDNRFYSGDAGEHGKIVGGLFQDSPQNAAAMILSLPTMLPDLADEIAKAGHPDVAQAITSAHQNLNRSVFTNVLLAQYMAAQEAGDAEMQELLSNVAKRVLEIEPWSPEAREERIRELEGTQQRQREAQQRARQESTVRWVTEANDKAVDQSLTIIKDAVTSLVGKVYREEAQNMLVGEIYRRVHEELLRDAGLVESVRAQAAAGLGDPRYQTQMVRQVVNRARQLIPGIAEKVISAFGGSTLAITRERQSVQDSAAARKDVTGTSGGASTKTIGKLPTPDELKKSGKYRTLSADDILDGKF